MSDRRGTSKQDPEFGQEPLLFDGSRESLSDRLSDLSGLCMWGQLLPRSWRRGRTRALRRSRSYRYCFSGCCACYLPVGLLLKIHERC